jgi:uncharacterized protein (TIGR04255 family)
MALAVDNFCRRTRATQQFGRRIGILVRFLQRIVQLASFQNLYLRYLVLALSTPDCLNSMTKSPKFNKPPVDEVSIGFSYHASSEINVLEFSKLWEKFKAQGFGTLQTHPPVPTRGSRVLQNVNFQFQLIPDVPRFWFIKDSGEYIVQVQRNKFAINWRIADEPTKSYVSFEVIQKHFWEYVAIFRAWFEETTKEKLRISEQEVTYFNSIPITGGINSDTVTDIYKDFQWSKKSVLPNKVSQLFFEVIVPVDELAAHMFILGHTAQKIETNEQIHRLELAVIEGNKVQEFNEKLMYKWYAEAHDKIVHGFVELTTPTMHKQWGYENV